MSRAARTCACMQAPGAPWLPAARADEPRAMRRGMRGAAVGFSSMLLPTCCGAEGWCRLMSAA